MFPSEKQFVDWLKARCGSRRGGLTLGVGDDAALIRLRPGTETILTTDLLVEDVHFLLRREPARSVGHRALARGLSDVAAMGGIPRFALVSLAVRKGFQGTWLREFYQGFFSLARRFGVKLIGGDTSLAPRATTVDMILVGEAVKGGAVRRSRARPGDKIFVSGRLGRSALGVKILRSKAGAKSSLHQRILRHHLYPQPRLALGQWLATNQLATAMLDISDGLAIDLHRLCDASGVGAHLLADHIPLAEPGPGWVKFPDLLNLALAGGEDYELLFTVPPKKVPQIPAAYRRTRLTQIGEIAKERRVEIISRLGEKKLLPLVGFDHFSG